MTLSLAPRGGFQGKAGYLKIPGSNASRRANQPGLTPTSWLHNREPKWFIVRDTYFVATDGPDATEFYDVFMLDEGFSIERPKRVLRTGLHIMTGHSSLRSATRRDVPLGHEKSSGRDAGGDGTGAEGEDGIDLDNPFAQEMIIASGEAHGQKIGVSAEEGDEHHASQHTFFIVNTQRRLKLVAKNAVSSAKGPGVDVRRKLTSATNAPVHREHGADRGAVGMDGTESIRLVCSAAGQCGRSMAR